jgi:hypothetical protein
LFFDLNSKFSEMGGNERQKEERRGRGGRGRRGEGEEEEKKINTMKGKERKKKN